MEHESRLFLASTLWNEPLPSLLTSRTTEVNARLAALYGLPFPPTDDVLDADGFGRVELTPERSGFLTQGAFLVSSASPSGHSIVRRSRFVMARLLCELEPSSLGKEDLPPEAVEAALALSDRSERVQASYRVETALCAECHAEIDPYGLALEHFDAMGAFRQVDEVGQPVDASAVLPAAVGAVPVAGAAELGRVLAESDRLARCLGATFLQEALSARWQVEVPAQSCEVDDIVAEFAAGSDPSFGGLVRAIALSPAFRERTKSE
jgi:hypothetical protein